MQVTTDSQPPTRLLTRIRPWLAVIVAAIIFTLIPVVGLPLFFALPLIGLALAAGSPPDYVVDAKTVARRPRNIILGMVVVLCLVATVLQPHLTLLLVLVFGLDAADLVVSLIAVAALTLPLAMADSGKLIGDLPHSRPVLTRRNLILCLTVAVTVTTWYAGPGLSYVPIAALVIGLPIPLVLSRLLAARHDRLQLGLLRNPLRGNLLPHWLQLVNMLVLCGLLASTLFTGAYDAAAFGFAPSIYRVFLIAFVGGLVVLLLVAAVPLKTVRMASNLLMLSGSLFIAAQLVMIFRPVGNRFRSHPLSRMNGWSVMADTPNW